MEVVWVVAPQSTLLHTVKVDPRCKNPKDHHLKVYVFFQVTLLSAGTCGESVNQMTFTLLCSQRWTDISTVGFRYPGVDLVGSIWFK